MFLAFNNSNVKNTQSNLKNYIPKDQLMKMLEEKQMNTKQSTKGVEEIQIKSGVDVNSNKTKGNKQKENAENKLESKSSYVEKENSMDIIEEES